MLSLAGSQLVDQLICCFWPGWRTAGWSAALGQSSGFGLESRGPRIHHFEPVGGAASLCSWCTPTRGFRCGCPVGGLGVVAQLGFQLWAPSPLIWMCATGLQVSARAAYPVFTLHGGSGEGLQRPGLLPRVL